MCAGVLANWGGDKKSGYETGLPGKKYLKKRAKKAGRNMTIGREEKNEEIDALCFLICVIKGNPRLRQKAVWNFENGTFEDLRSMHFDLMLFHALQIFVGNFCNYVHITKRNLPFSSSSFIRRPRLITPGQNYDGNSDKADLMQHICHGEVEKKDS